MRKLLTGTARLPYTVCYSNKSSQIDSKKAVKRRPKRRQDRRQKLAQIPIFLLPVYETGSWFIKFWDEKVSPEKEQSLLRQRGIAVRCEAVLISELSEANRKGVWVKNNKRGT